MTYSTLSEIGNRIENEDSVGTYIGKKCQVFFLADGLGGHGSGKEASESVIRHGIELMELEEDSEKDMNVQEKFSQIFAEGHELLKVKQKDQGSRQSMRTTLSIFLARGEEGWLAHIGDSRIYVFERGELKFRTLDHSVPQILALAGEIAESEIRHHPDRNRLLRCMGESADTLKYEIHEPILIRKGTAILMCSDGFWEAVAEEQMIGALWRSRNVKDWLHRMQKRVEKSGKKGEQDNYSAIGIWF
ncbi:PP2C family protein-serine/threonine phosphatase [Bariatricus sp. SGI.154]|uniref:PP2C family protein-serine/threonine phosphatase n=1 Tax=Bariatricus sp. SGI.154 TaxID=3420549 RepID=UPI003D002A65